VKKTQERETGDAVTMQLARRQTTLWEWTSFHPKKSQFHQP